MTGDLRLPPGSPDGKGQLLTSWTLFFQHIIQRLRVFIGDTGDGGIIGLVPAPDAGDSAGGKYLKADGTWDVPPGTSTGTITATGALTLNHIVIGNGGVDEKVLASSGTTSTVLHGDAAGPPTFAAVTESELSITDNTTGNVSITAHGFAPKAPNDSTKFLNGVGAYAVPAGGGSGTVTHTGSLTANQLILGNGTADITALGSLGTTTTVYHGNASGAGTFGAVVEADITLANNTTNNVTTSKHGFAPILPNVATQYLDGTGAYSVPAGTGGTSGFTLLEQHTASSSATLDFTTCITSTYDTYEIQFVNIIPATSGAIFWMRMSTDGGSTYDTSSIYSYELLIWRAAASTTGGNTAQSKIILTGNGLNTSANWGLCGRLTLSSPLSATLYKQITGQHHNFDSFSGGLRESCQIGGTYESSTAVNAFRFLMDTGNIASGTIRVYGLGL